MKKFFTLIAVAVMAMGVNAQTWNFSDFENKEYAEPETVNGLFINATSDQKITIDTNKKTVDEVQYTKRLKFGGKGSPTTRNISFNATGAGDLKLIITSANASDDRTLGVALEGTEVAEFTAKGSVVEAVTTKISGAGTVSIYSKSGACNLYLVEFTASGGSAEGVEVWDAASLPFDEKTKTILDVVKTENTSGSYIIPAEIKQFPEGTFPENAIDVATWLDQQDDPSIYAITLNDYVFTASTANVSLKAVSTPNATENDKPDVECWQSAGGEESNMALNTADCPIKWTNYVKAKNGNPSLGYYNYYDTNSDGDAVNRVSDVLWSIGCGKAPGKGSYFEFTFKKAGAMVMGVYLNRPNQSSVVVIDKETLAPLTYTDLSFQGFCQNNTVKYPNNGEDSTDPTFQTFQFRDDYTINVEANASRPLIGYLSFPVEAKTYMVFQPSSQLGIYGFQFTEGGSTNGVETITANKVWNADAPMYNLAGQKVDKSYKGIVIQNGRKFYNK